jgi:hypothetical protein
MLTLTKHLLCAGYQLKIVPFSEQAQEKIKTQLFLRGTSRPERKCSAIGSWLQVLPQVLFPGQKQVGHWETAHLYIYI